MPKAKQTVGDYLIASLQKMGINHVFGIPGDYVLGFYDRMLKSSIEIINTCDELGAGYAADGYARVNGAGALCVTYGVGGLKVINSTAMAHAERSPVVILSGAPGISEQAGDMLLHHKVADFKTQYKIFQHITVAAAILDDPAHAAQEIDRVLAACAEYKRPVYIELPRDVEKMPVRPAPASHAEPESPDPATLQEAMDEVLSMLNNAIQPVVLAGLELHRFGLQKEFLQFLEKTGFPCAATLMGKTVIPEDHPQFIGVYSGSMCRPEVAQYVESSDCMLLLGAMLTDMNTGVWTAEMDPARTIASTVDDLQVKRHHYNQITLTDFMAGLNRASIAKRAPGQWPKPLQACQFKPSGGREVTVERLFQCINCFITPETIVVADIGDSLFAAAELVIPGGPEFLSCAYYTSVGFAIPASLGASMAAPKRKLLVIAGDGAFQMSGNELSTIVRNGLNPTVLVLNNGGYGTERPMLEGSFNDIHVWNYHRTPDVLGHGKGYYVQTEEELMAAMSEAGTNDEFSLIEVQLGTHDFSPALQRLTAGLARKVAGD